MSLELGENERHPAFDSDEERRDAWAIHRDALLAGERPGRRPRAWWQYESPIPYPGPDHETVTLYEAGLMSDEEIAEITPWWREQFDRSFDEHFFHVLGPGRLLEGAAARKAHYRWARIPPEIVKRWTAERGRQTKTIRKLAKV
jgi:hypothetical protein